MYSLVVLEAGSPRSRCGPVWLVLVACLPLAPEVGQLHEARALSQGGVVLRRKRML